MMHPHHRHDDHRSGHDDGMTAVSAMPAMMAAAFRDQASGQAEQGRHNR